jgi:hypothetical protein
MRGMGMRGQGMLIGAIIGSRHGKKRKGYHQPGGILLYLGIPVVGFFCALNNWGFASELDNPPQPIWLGPLIIILGTIALTWFVAWLRKEDRKEHTRQMELKRLEWQEKARNGTLFNRHINK